MIDTVASIAESKVAKEKKRSSRMLRTVSRTK